MTAVGVKTARGRRLFSAAIIIFAALSWAPAHADRTDPLPKNLEGVGVDEQLGATVPLDLVLRDESGQPVVLKSVLNASLPTLLVPHYSNCPMLCNLVVGGLVRALRQIEWAVGEKFSLVFVSIDPAETAERSAKTKARYLKEYGRPSNEDAWHFLTGDAASVAALTKAVGFRYRYVEERKEYAHPAAIMVLTPAGRIARYLYGIDVLPQTLRLSLVEASEGKISSPVDTFLLYCFHYDAESGRYAPVAMNIMRLGAGLTAVTIAGVLIRRWRRDVRQRRAGEEEAYV
ncbi:MAG: SCO family protein [Myxococcales bacterium]|nr:SCO family protein [Myxococcales bacterium]